MTDLDSSVVDIINELKSIQTMTITEITKNGSFDLPRMIGVGNGGGIIVSQRIDELIELVSRELKLRDPSLAFRVKDDEWASSVRAAFGPALASIDLDVAPKESAIAVLEDLKRSLAQKSSQYGKREFAFGCTLFSERIKVSSFSIGPVRFEHRLDWLDRKSAEGDVSLTSQRRIERSWKGGKLAKRKTSIDSVREKDILDVVGSAPYVCSLSTSGFAKEAGLEKALTVARLALTSISLVWQMPSKALDGLNLTYDRTPVIKRALTFVPGAITLSGWKLSHMPHGPYLEAGEWEKRLVSAAGHFRISGEILEYFVSPTGRLPRPKLMNTLGQALLWFHEGCRETVTLMAIVKFAASMDALGGGHRSNGIRQIFNARLDIKDGDPIRPGGPTLKAVIDRIYNEGRSRTIHGTNEKLGHDWSSVRTLAEQLARLCLLACIDWAEQNPTSDDPSLLTK